MITIPTKPFDGRDAELDERQAAADQRAVRLQVVEREINECNAIIANGDTGANSLAAKTLAYMGLAPAPGSPEEARQKRDALMAERVLLRGAIELDRRWIEERRNKVSAGIAAELRADFARLNADRFEKWIALARSEELICAAQERMTAAGIFWRGYLPQLVYGTSPHGTGRHDLHRTESVICTEIRKAFEAGYLTGREQFLTGVNWRRG